MESGAVVTTDATPAGAIAVAANITAVNTIGTGFATVNPGGDTSVGASALNWVTQGSIVANAGIFRLNDSRELNVFIGGITNIDLLVDITGYWL